MQNPRNGSSSPFARSSGRSENSYPSSAFAHSLHFHNSAYLWICWGASSSCETQSDLAWAVTGRCSPAAAKRSWPSSVVVAWYSLLEAQSAWHDSGSRRCLLGPTSSEYWLGVSLVLAAAMPLALKDHWRTRSSHVNPSPSTSAQLLPYRSSRLLVVSHLPCSLLARRCELLWFQLINCY